MKRTLILLLLLLIGLGAYFYLNSSKDDRMEQLRAERNFAVDKELIHKVVLTQKDGKVNTIVRNGAHWTINGQRMFKNQEHLLLEALSRIRMERIPLQGAYKAVMTRMAKRGILVRIYGKDGEQLRSYYVGGAPHDEKGTYYLMEGSSQPYLMSLPGMVGSVRGRFIKPDTDWLDRAIFRYPNKDIKTIEMDYPRSKNNAFILKKNGNDLAIEPMYPFTNKNTGELNTNLVEDYLSGYYKGFFTEAYENNFPQRDSIVQHMVPFIKMRVTNTKDEVRKMDIYPYHEVHGLGGKIDGTKVDRNVERYYVNVDDGKNFMLTQHLITKKFIKGYDFFFK